MYKHRFLKRILVELSVLVLFIFAVCYFFFEDIKNKNQNYHLISDGLSAQNSRINYLVSTQKTIDGLDSQIRLMNDSVVSKEGEVGFIEELESIARESGLSIAIDSLVLDNNLELAPNSIDILKIKGKVAGSWSGNYKFLARLESLPVKVKINRFSLTNTSSEETVGKWQGVFELDVLKYK